MKGYQKSYWLWLFLVGLVLAGCGYENSQNESLSSPVPEPSQTARKSTISAPTVFISSGCKKIAFVLFSETNSDIYTICPDGSNLTQLTTDPSADISPAWSPDGSRIVFASSRTGSSQIYIMSGEGNNPLKLTTDYENDFPIWLPSGKQIALRTTDTKGLWWWRIVNLESNEITQLSEPSYDFFFQTPAWSRYGQNIAYMSLVEQKQRNDGSSQIHVKNVDGSDDLALTSDIWANINPVWSPDGTKIGFLSERDGTYNVFALYVMSRDGKNLKKLTKPTFPENATLTWSPDGQQIAISNFTQSGNIYVIDIKTGNSRRLLHLPDGESASAPSWQP